MAIFRAYSSFQESNFSLTSSFDLSSTLSAQESSTFGDNVNQTIAGRKYQDVAAYETRFNAHHSIYFGGTALARGTDTALSAGTVTGIFDYSGQLNTFTAPAYTIQGIALGGAEVGAAQRTASTLDDGVLLAKALAGNDRFVMSEQDDQVSAETGDDIMYGNGGNDQLYGGGGNDTLNGGAGDDSLYGQDGNDRLYGGAGNDWLEGGRGDDLLYGNAGIDTASYQLADASVTVDLRITVAQDTGGAGIDTLSGIEQLRGSAFADRLTGNSGDNWITGWRGDDILIGKGGNDYLSGGLGRDTLTGGTGADRFAIVNFTGSAERDFITDFSHAQGDKILLLIDNFPSLSGDLGAPLSAAQFHAAAGATKAHDADDRIIYNPVTGIVYYDADGAGGLAPVQVLKMGAGVHPTLEAGDFLLFG